MKAPAFIAPHWKRYVDWFTARLPREKAIIAAAVLGGILFIGFTYAIEPQLLAARRATKTILEANNAAMQSGTTADILQKTNLDPDAPLRAELAQLHSRLEEQSRNFDAVDRSLVPPEKIPVLLENLLTRSRNLQLKSLETLAPAPLIDRKPAKADAPAAAAAAAANALATAALPNLFKHGVKIRISGSYADLLAYVTELESAPQRLMWGRMDLVADYPKAELTLTVYTLSLEKSWLVL